MSNLQTKRYVCAKCVGGGNLEFHSNGGGVLSFFLSFLSPGNWSFRECGGIMHWMNEEEAPQPVCWLSGIVLVPLFIMKDNEFGWSADRPILTNTKTKQFCTLQNSLSSVVVVVLGLCISNLTFFEVVNLLLLHQSCFGDFKIWLHFGSFFSDRYKMEQFVACTLTHSRLFLFALFPYRKPPTCFKHSREAPTSTKMEFCCVWGFRV